MLDHDNHRGQGVEDVQCDGGNGTIEDEIATSSISVVCSVPLLAKGNFIWE